MQNDLRSYKSLGATHPWIGFEGSEHVRLELWPSVGREPRSGDPWALAFYNEFYHSNNKNRWEESIAVAIPPWTSHVLRRPHSDVSIQNERRLSCQNAGGGATPWVSTDKADYAPGQVVIITASGFTPRAAVRFTLRDLDEDPGADGDADDYGSFLVVDGSAEDLDGEVNGTIVTHWRVPTTNNGQISDTPDALDATLRLTAQEVRPGKSGQLKAPGAVGVGPLAIHTFTDSGSSLAITAITPDTGISGTDFLTNAKNLTISGTNPALIDGQTLRISTDGGANWTPIIPADPDGITWSFVDSERTESVTYKVQIFDSTDTPIGAAVSRVVQIDIVAPTVAISSSDTNLTIGETALITFTFSEDPGLFFVWNEAVAATYLEVTGGTLSNFSGADGIRTAIFTPDPGVDATTATINVKAGLYSDAAGNPSAPSTPLALAVDTQAPNLTISSDVTTLLAGQTALITFSFNEEPAAFGNSQVSVSGGALSAITPTTDSKVFTATFTPTVGVNGGTASIGVTAGAYTDAAGNLGPASALSPAITYDTATPELTISSDKSSLLAGQTALITFTFSEDPGSSFSWDGTNGDVVVSGGVLSAISGSGLTRIATFTPDANSNNVNGSISVTAGTYSDTAGNPGAGAALNPAITLDVSVPTLAISALPTSLKAGETAVITFTFSEDPGATFSWDGLDGDVVVSGGVLSAISNSGLIRTATFTPTPNQNNGTASIVVAAGSYSDAAGNTGAGANLAINYDTLAPSTAIATAVLSGADTGTSNSDWITSNAGLIVSGTLSQPLQDGEAVQVSADNGTNWVNATASAGSSDWSYATPLSGSGTFKARVVDQASNAGPLYSKVYRIDEDGPRLTAQYPTAGATAVALNHSIILSFNEPIVAGGGQVTAQKGSDTGSAIIITLTAGQKSGSFQTGAASNVSGTAPVQLIQGTWTIAGNKLILDPSSNLTGSNQWRINIGSNAIKDEAGNALTAITSTSSSGIYFTTGISTDTTRPTVNPNNDISLSVDTGVSGTDFNTREAWQTIRGTLSGPLAAGDLVQISLNNGTTWSYVDSCATGSSNWSHRAALLEGTNTLRVRVVDAAGNVARAFAVFNDNGLGQTYTLDATAPTAPVLTLGTGADDGVTRAEAIQASGIVLVTGGTGTITVVFQSGVGTLTKTVTSQGGSTAVAVVLTASDLPFLGSGVVNVSATVADLAGNVSSPTTTSFVFDAVPPAAVVNSLSLSSDSFGAGTSGTAADFITQTGAQTIGGTLSQALANGEVVRVSLDNGLTWQTATITTPDTSWVLTGVFLSANTTVVARVQDALGNFSAPLSRALVLDQSATPNVIALGSGVADGATALEATAAGGVVSVTAEAGAAVNVVFSRSGGGSVTKSLIGDGTPQAIQLSPTDLNTLGDGEIIVVANQVDIAGNTASSSGSFRLDRSAPGAPQITSPSVTSKVLNHTIRGTAEANALVEVREGTTLLGTTKANAQGQWEALVFLGGQGSHSIQAYQTDQTGNRGPTASNAVVITVDVLGSAPTFTKEDLQFMLLQIGIAEAHNTRMGGDAGIRADFETDGLYNVEASQAFLRAVLGPGFDFEPLGLRSVEGFNNNLQPAQAQFGAADQSFSPATIGAVGVPTLNSNYDGDGAGANPSYAYKTATTSGNVTDSSPRLISNLIADQSTSNAAAVSASQEQQALLDPELQRSANLAALQPQLDPRTGQTIMTVLNVAPNPANAPYNSFLTLFGQGFDHGLDFIDKGGSGTVFVPILQGDPLYSTAPGAVNMIMVTRATVDANGNTTNRTTPWIDMNQAYASHASMQVFLRDYLRTGNQTLATGKLLEGSTGGLPNWADVKAQALSKLGIRLTDADVSNAPLLVTDEYGRFIPGVNGYAQVVVTTGTNSYAVLEGSEQGLALTGTGYAALRTNHAFLLDIAHSANPGSINAPKTADGDSAIGLKNADGTSPTPNGQGQYSVYDNELLDAHWIAGDGRVNENTGLTAFHTLFHNEHDRLVDDYKRIAVESGDLTFLNQWLRTPLNALPTSVAEVAVDNWNGERLFQAARFVVEMQYQHSVFEEFGRFIDPGIAEDTGYLPNLNPAITREFANVVYRFGHSMLNETVDRFTPDWQNTSQGLIAAFINPTAFTDPLNPDNNPATATYTAEQAAGQILRGMTRQQGNAIDEFTTGALRNNLIGLPLDLAAINLTRARELGIPRLNDARRQFYAITNNLKLTPYQNWNDFANHLKHPASLINFVAAYGTHPELIKLRDPNTQGSDPTQTGTYLAGFTPATRLSLLRSKAMELIPPQSSTGLLLGGSGSHKDSAAFINATGSFANRLGGVDDIDFWIGGLAEKTEALVGMLGSTFSFVFTQQMQALQNADRLYYLRRLPGNLLTQVEQNTFSAMAQRTMDVTSLPGHVFSLPTYTLEVDPSKQLTNLGNGKADPVYANRANATAADIGYSVDNTIRWNGGHVVLVGSEARDLLKGGNENDTLYGRGSADVLIGGDGDDQIWGGDGDDFIFDSAGLNVLRGESGNDVMVGGSGLSLLFGGRGKDWMVSGTGGLGNELFGEEGDDFISASDAGSAGRGGAGDDWFEGNSLGGADGYSLDDGMAGLVNINGNAIPQAVGHDVSLSRAGDDKIFGDFGNDIFIDGSGIDDYAGQQGFDWVSFARNGRDPGGTANNGGAIDLSQIVPAGVVRATINADLTDLHVEAVGGSQYADVMIGDDRTDLVGGNVFLNRNNDLAINGLDRDLVAPFRSITLSDLVLQGNQRNPVVNTHYDLIVDPGTGQLVWGVAGGISVNRALDDRLFDLPLDSGGIKGLFSNYLSTAPSGGTFAALIPTALRQTQEVNTRPHPQGTGINIAPVIVGSVANSSVPGFPDAQGVIDVPAYFNAGNVLIGGQASDRFLGKAGDDVIDGDAWLNVELEWRNPINQQVVRFADMKAVNDANLVLGLAIKQEDLHIVRELCSNPFEADGTTRANDMAIYYGRPDEYLFEGQRRVYVASTPGGILETDPTPVDYQEDPNTGFPLNYPANGLGIPDVRERDLNGNLLTTTFDQNAFFNNFHPRTTIIGTPTDLDGDGFITITYAPTQAQISDPLRGLPPLNQGTDYLRNIETVRFVLPGVANPTGNASDLLSGLIAPTASSIYTSRIGSSGATYTYSTFRDGTFLDVDVKSFMPTTGAVLPSVSNGQTPIPDPDTNKVFNFQQASPALPTLSMRLTSDTGRSNSDNISQQAGITVTLPGSGNYLYQWSNSGDYFSPNWRALPAAATTGTPPTVSITQAQVNSAFGLSQGVNTLYFRLIENKDGGRIGDSQAFSFTYDTTAPGAPTQTGVGQTIGTQVSPDPWAYDAGGQLFYSQTGATGTFTSVSQPATKPYYVQVEDAAGNRGAVAKSQFFYDLQAGRYNDGNTASPGNNTAGTGYLLVSNYQPGEKFLVDPDATKYFFKDNYTTADGKTGIGVFKDDGTGNGGSIGSAIPGSWDGRDELLALIVKEDMIAQMFTVTETRDPITNTMISKSYGVDPSKLANWTFTASTSSSTRDALSGGQAGIFDTFRLGALNQALLPTTNTGSSTSFDRIIGLNANEDMIDSPFARTSPIKPTVNTKAVTALTTSAIAAVLTKSTFAANGAATFVFGTGTSTRTFLALNDATAGFGTADAVLEITGFTGSLSNLAVF